MPGPFEKGPCMRQTNPSDISRETFENVLPILERARKKTRPREVD